MARFSAETRRRLHAGSSFRASHHSYRGRSRSRSPFRKDKSRSRSPYHPGKHTNGQKRRHEDDHYGSRASSDPRRFRVHYENGIDKSAGHGSGSQYADLDRPAQPKSHLQYDDHVTQSRKLRRYESPSERSRDRSRSPFRRETAKAASKQVEDDKTASRPSRGDKRAIHERTGSLAAHGNVPEEDGDSNIKVSLSKHAASSQGPGASNIDATSDRNHEKANSQKPLSEAELIEQRRKRREAIKARHKHEPSLLVQALEQSSTSGPATPTREASEEPSAQQSPISSHESPRTPVAESPPQSLTTFTLADDEDLADRRQTGSQELDESGPSAADYDPNMDMQEDRPDFKKQENRGPTTPVANVGELQQEPRTVPEASDDFDMFADEGANDGDDDDMFAPANTTVKVAPAATKARALDQSLLDNWDYPDGHYRIILGELLDGRYAVQQQIGKGTFATVVRAQDMRAGSAGNQVAIKIACNNETMYKAGQKEMDMLQILNTSDPDDKKHVIRLLRSFDHKGHLCLVFESLSADLREVLKKFGRNVGLNLKAVKSYAQQMFLALSHLKRCQILHADLKPDNILVSDKRSLLKVCDLGTAAFADDAEVTPYLVSRFYRAPEVILGVPFDYAIDMWSIGCTLFELYTGRILFAGSDNNQMLRVIQECRGKIPIRILKRSTLAEKHFDLDGNFFSQERDKVTNKSTLRQVNFSKIGAGKDLRARLSANTRSMTAEEIKEHALFVDLMDKCLQLDPARRITPNEALRHNFVSHAPSAPQGGKTREPVKVAMAVPKRK